MSTQFECQKAVLFQTIQFSIRIQFSSILPIDKTLSGLTTLCQIEPGSEVNGGYTAFPKVSALLEPRHQIVQLLNFEGFWRSGTKGKAV